MIVRDGAEEVTPRVYLASVLRAEISLLSNLPGGEETTVPLAWPPLSLRPYWRVLLHPRPQETSHRASCD